MSDFNLFSSKTDIKKLLFTTDKFKFDEQCSTDSWQDLPGATLSSVHSSFIHNPPIQTSTFSDNRNDYGWETLDDYSTIPKSYGNDYEKVSKKSSSYCRLDRRGHWLLLPPPPPPIHPLLHTDAKKVVTYFNSKRFSRNSTQLQQPEQNFRDSYESLTVSMDFHVPEDEFLIDNDNLNRQKKPLWINKMPQIQHQTSDESHKKS
ncbi:unnamed protein product, partial [Rotaria magnacalcarata]